MQITPDMYARIFENNPEGAAILEELVKRFCRSTYVRGGHEADREGCYRAGRFAVVQHIIDQIEIAKGEGAYVDDETQFNESSGL